MMCKTLLGAMGQKTMLSKGTKKDNKNKECNILKRKQAQIPICISVH